MAQEGKGTVSRCSSCNENNNRWSLQGKTALVTGETKGIGLPDHVVEELARLGAIVYTCSRNEAELNECLKDWESKGFRVTGSACDGSSKSEREKLMFAMSSLLDGKLNILINNVGTSITKPTVDYMAEDFSFIMTTNFESGYHLSQLAHPLLKSSGAGSIVFLSSVCGVILVNGESVYSATKGAMNQLTKNLACEWAKDSIRSNSIVPWFILTPLTEPVIEFIVALNFLSCSKIVHYIYLDHARHRDLMLTHLSSQQLSNEKHHEEVVARTPLDRTGEPEEVSSLVAFVCLPVASYITG